MSFEKVAVSSLTLDLNGETVKVKIKGQNPSLGSILENLVIPVLRAKGFPDKSIRGYFDE